VAANFQTGQVPVNHDAALQQEVVFGTAFGVAPQVVIPIIRYTGGPGPILLEVPLILSIDTAKFKVQYNDSVSEGADSTEYFIGYMAGDNNAVFDAILNPGVKVPNLPATAETVVTDDKLILYNSSNNKVEIVPISKFIADLSL
jgi:hypothetical protein